MQADVLTIGSLGCHAATVVTAITTQDTSGVSAFTSIPPDDVRSQARAVLADMPVAAFKVGMTGSAETVAVIAEIAAEFPNIPLILDPVLASGRGDPLGNTGLRHALVERLLPRATIATPNSVEARALADALGRSCRSLDTCAKRILDTGCSGVLITGTHEKTADVINTLYRRGEKPLIRSWPRLPGEYHGSGCTLAAAIAAMLAQGLDVIEACVEAQNYTVEALRHAFAAGRGQALPDRLFWARA